MREKMSELEIETENVTEKYKNSREAQKLAEVKVMELEQRLSTVNTKSDTYKDDMAKLEAKHTESSRQAKEFGKRLKELEKEKKQTEVQQKQLIQVRLLIIFVKSHTGLIPWLQFQVII